MYVILVYDTAAERNPRVLRTCRRYLHWTQRSVFQGQLSVAQHRTLTAALTRAIDPHHDSVRIYRIPGPDLVHIDQLGAELGTDDSIL
jgi:CRISPR-associated protein Cas2